MPTNAHTVSGLECPLCGCADLRVSHTRKCRGRIRRRRVCQHCFEGFWTTERPHGVASEKKNATNGTG